MTTMPTHEAILSAAEANGGVRHIASSKALLGDSYRDEREALMLDPIVWDMTGGLIAQFATPDKALAEIAWPPEAPATEPELPRSGFSMAASNEYRKRGGQHAHTIGGVSGAIVTMLNLINQINKGA
jgi:hypothetical protein